MPTRLPFLDGVRGLAALYVVLFHCWIPIHHGRAVPDGLAAVIAPFSSGRSAVVVFIVLSGFCLGLPVARHGELRGGVAGFLKRRAVRTMPAYLAAVALGVAALALVPAAFTDPGRLAHISWTDRPAESVLLHAVMLHNLFPEHVWALNGSLWSMAAEWQIYLVFALAFVPLRKRTGSGGPVVFGLALAAAAVAVGGETLARSGLWLVGGFPLGMWAADAAVKGSRGPWAAVAGLTAAGFGGVLGWMAASGTYFLGPEKVWLPAFDLAVAAGTAAGLVALSRPVGVTTDRVRRVLESRPLVGLGAFSYSLYLCHHPLLAVLDLTTDGLTPWGRAAVLFGVGVPGCVAGGWAFCRLFERPWLTEPVPRPITSSAVAAPRTAP